MSGNETIDELEHIDLTQPDGPAEFTVYRDGEVEIPPQPSLLERIHDRARTRVRRFTGHVALQVQMTAYDTLHGTQYRQIRNEIMREKRDREFEQRIGLTRTDDYVPGMHRK